MRQRPTAGERLILVLGPERLLVPEFQVHDVLDGRDLVGIEPGGPRDDGALVHLGLVQAVELGGLVAIAVAFQALGAASGITISTSLRDNNTVGVIAFSAKLPDVARYCVRLAGVTGTAKTVGGITIKGNVARIRPAKYRPGHWLTLRTRSMIVCRTG
jgi:hypothetical protein